MQLAHALITALKEHGAREIFGIPGDFALPFFREIDRLGLLPLVTLSHEPAVGFAADAASRYRGSIGVAVVTYGAGAFNLVNSIAGAYAERSPVVVIAGAPTNVTASCCNGTLTFAALGLCAASALGALFLERAQRLAPARWPHPASARPHLS